MFNRWAQTHGALFGLRETSRCTRAITQGAILKVQQQSQSLIKGYQSPSVTETKLFSYCTTKSHFMYFHVSINVGLYTVSLRHCSPWLPSFTLLFFCQLNQASQCFHGVLMSTCSDGKEDSSKQQPLSASEEQHYAQFTKNKPKLTMHWTKTTPNRIEIKINSHADRHILAFLQLQAVVLALRADCAAGLLIFTNKKPDAAGTGIGEARKKTCMQSHREHTHVITDTTKSPEIARIIPLSWHTISGDPPQVSDFQTGDKNNWWVTVTLAYFESVSWLPSAVLLWQQLLSLTDKRGNLCFSYYYFYY